MKSVFFKLSFIVIIIIALMILSPRQSLLSQKYDDESVFVNVTVAGQVQRVLLDDYLLGVVAGEMPASFELEAIKAQVVASRTFVYSRLLSVDNTTNTQVYLNEEEMKKSWQDHYEEYKAKIQKAIEATRGEIMTYQGECISALFYSSSNGKSENVENYFAGSPKSYLVSVDSPWDEKYDSSFLREKSFSRAELNQCFGDFVYRDIIRYPSGRVQSIVINGKNYTGRQVREKLQLASSDFTIEKEGDDFVFVTKGNGHGVGMSQYGAQGMAKEGYGYVDILKHYYQGIDITRNKE
ncbi:stage II sporulation protein D [[Clostridium] spiroforme]|nr:stage II sporulation protein D [Thomasclavelia spiroformis]